MNARIEGDSVEISERENGLLRSERISTIRLGVLTHYHNVTDRQTDRYQVTASSIGKNCKTKVKTTESVKM